MSGAKKSKATWGVVILLLGLVGAASVYFLFPLFTANTQVESEIDQHFASLAGYSASSDQLVSSVSQASYAATATAATENSLPLADNNPVNDDPADVLQNSKKGSRSKSKTRKSRRSKKQKKKNMVDQPQANQWSGIKKIAAGTYLVDSNLVASAQKNPKKYLTGTKAQPLVKNKQTVGFEILGIHKSAPLYALGLRNMDVLTAINGRPLNSPNQAVAAAIALRNASRFRLDVLRNGQRRSLYYQID